MPKNQTQVTILVTDQQADALVLLLKNLTHAKIRELGLAPEQVLKATEALYFFEKRLLAIAPSATAAA